MLVAFALGGNAIALGVALLINRRPFGYRVYRTLIFLPVILSLTATGFIWSVILNPQIGLLNPALKAIGLGFIHPLWLASPTLALASVIVVSWWQWGGVPVVVYEAGLKVIPRELLDSAEVDGASPFARLRHVVLPLLRPAISINAILTVVTVFQSFAVVFVLEGVEGAPNFGTDVAGTLIYRTAFGLGTYGATSNLGFAEANAVCVMVVVGIGLLLIQSYFRRRMVDF
jgi:raffinose/stachyose/melibiose transport system permease protein